jgi:hypothetical protein
MAIVGDMTSMPAAELSRLRLSMMVIHKSLLTRMLLPKATAADNATSRTYSAIAAGGDALHAVAVLQLARLVGRKNISNTKLASEQTQLRSELTNFEPATTLVQRVTAIVSGLAIDGGAPSAAGMCQLGPELRR